MAQSKHRDDQLFTGPVTFSRPVQLPTYTVATVPTAVGNDGSLIYVSNGAAGAEVVAFSDGTDWLRVDTKLTIAAA